MSHKSHDIFTERKQFQLERIILFSDAVFAIAITLLVIEIKVPIVDSYEDLKHQLSEKRLEFFGFVLSFAVIGQFWTNHHKLFGYITDYNRSLIWLNLHMLLWIVLVPFTSGLNSHYGNINLVWQIYSLNLFMIGLSLYFLFRYIGSTKRNISTLRDEESKKYTYARSMAISLIFLLGFVFAMFDNLICFWISRSIYFLIFPVIMIINRVAHKKTLKLAHNKKAS